MSDLAPELQTFSSPHAAPSDALADAVRLVESDLAAAERRLEELLATTVAVIPHVGGHLAFAGGKRFRPLVALLAAQACGYEHPGRITIAAVGELLHTATLLHDDVIDGGEFRRGRPAARIGFGNGMAVLTGDYCLARGLQAVAALGDVHAVRTMADAVTRMAEGEVAQLDIAGDFSLDHQRYYMVIDRKTAALIAWCAGVAGLVGTRDHRALERYGLELGYAFQIADDVIDYRYDVGRSGKARGQDLREGKMTLPLVLACENDPALAEAVRRLLAQGPPADDAEVDRIVDAVVASEAPAQAAAIASRHAERACQALVDLEPSAARSALETLAHYVTRRST